MSELQGQRALVTGGTRGIGAAIARHLHSAGARVVVAARSRGDYDGPGHFIAADVSTAAGPTLVPDGALAMTDADWLADINACLLSAVRLDREVLPGMIDRGGGAIVHIGSNAARLPRPAALAYAAAKAALATYSKGLASQVGRHNVRINLVSPGVIETAAFAARIRFLADQAGTDLDTARQDFISSFNIPLERPGTADDVAALVTFLVSPSASYLTGTNHVIDGGLLPTV